MSRDYYPPLLIGAGSNVIGSLSQMKKESIVRGFQVISGTEGRSEVTGRDYYHATSIGCRIKVTRVTESRESRSSGKRVYGHSRDRALR